MMALASPMRTVTRAMMEESSATSYKTPEWRKRFQALANGTGEGVQRGLWKSTNGNTSATKCQKLLARRRLQCGAQKAGSWSRSYRASFTMTVRLENQAREPFGC